MVKVALSWDFGVAFVLGGVGCTRGVLASTVAKGRMCFARPKGLLVFNASPDLAALVIWDSIIDLVVKSFPILSLNSQTPSTDDLPNPAHQ